MTNAADIRNKPAVEAGKLRAAEYRAMRGPEAAAKADLLAASVPDRLRRMYVGPENSKGRQAFHVEPPDHLSPQFLRSDA